MNDERLKKILPLSNLLVLSVLAISLPLLVFVSLQNTRLLSQAALWPPQLGAGPGVGTGATSSCSSCSPVIEYVGESIVQGSAFGIDGYDFNCQKGKVYLSDLRDAYTGNVLDASVSLKVISWMDTKIVANAPSGFDADVEGELYVQTAGGLNSNQITVRFIIGENQPMITPTPTPAPFLPMMTPTPTPAPFLPLYCPWECQDRGYNDGVCRTTVCSGDEIDIGSAYCDQNETCCCQSLTPTPTPHKGRRIPRFRP